MISRKCAGTVSRKCIGMISRKKHGMISRRRIGTVSRKEHGMISRKSTGTVCFARSRLFQVNDNIPNPHQTGWNSSIDRAILIPDRQGE
jgi:hypothetical protein